MEEIPNSFIWFIKLNLVKFIPWHFEKDLTYFSSFNTQFKKENPKTEVLTFANRQDMDTFAGFEIIDEKVTEKVIVFHLTFSNNSDWNIIEAEYDDLFDFVSKEVLPTMKNWILDDDVEDYLD